MAALSANILPHKERSVTTAEQYSDNSVTPNFCP